VRRNQHSYGNSCRYLDVL